MYKFEISADSPQELKQKQIDFAEEIINEFQRKLRPPAPVEQYNDGDDEGPATFAPPPTQSYSAPIPPPAYSNAHFNSQTLTTNGETPVSTMMPVNEPTVTVTSGTDNRGFPWDERIHAATRTFNKDGTWRYKRGVDDATINNVEQELLAKLKTGPLEASPAPVATPTRPIQQTASPLNLVPPVPVPGVAVAQPTFQQPTTDIRSQSVAATPNHQATNTQTVTSLNGVVPAHSYASFKNNLTVLLAQLVNDGKIDQNYIQSLKNYFGVQEIWNILGNEAQCIELYNTFGEIGLITKVD